MIVNKKKRKGENLLNFAVAADNRGEIEENEKREREREKYLDLARELRKLSDMKVTVIPIANGALETVLKGLVRALEEL